MTSFELNYTASRLETNHDTDTAIEFALSMFLLRPNFYTAILCEGRLG